MTIANGVNSLGLVCDIIGAYLVWKYGLPERLSGAGHLYLVGKTDEAEIAKAKRYS